MEHHTKYLGRTQSLLGTVSCFHRFTATVGLNNLQYLMRPFKKRDRSLALYFEALNFTLVFYQILKACFIGMGYSRQACSKGTRDVNLLHKHLYSFTVMSLSVQTRSQTNLASWTFTDEKFSPKSIVSINGHQDDRGLLRIRTDLSPAPHKPPIVLKSNAAIQTITEQSTTQQVCPMRSIG